MAEIIGLLTMTPEQVCSSELIQKIFDEDDEFDRSMMLLSCQDRAKTLGCKTRFDEMVKAYRKEVKKAERADATRGDLTRYTEFDTGGRYNNMLCGFWKADDSGVYRDIDHEPWRLVACDHPILPVEELVNVETGERRVRLAYRRRGQWQELPVLKEVIASANKIIMLANYGVQVNSNNARHLVNYLSEVEFRNEDSLPVQLSSTKLGWHGDQFVPYDTDEIIFDGDVQFAPVFNSIKTRGSFEAWLNEIKKLRDKGRPEIKLMIAASLASVLVELIGSGQTFFTDFYGMTERGKTVLMMVGASVWADPKNGAYIGDFKTTDTFLEVKADMLNSLPLMLDDTAKADRKIIERFEQVVYELCSQRGKGRSNKELGVNRPHTWKNIIITNGEMALNSYMGKGGALNRILEIRMQEEALFDDPTHLINVLQSNYGHMGKLFVEAVKLMDAGVMQAMYDDFCDKLKAPDKMDKQINSMAYLLTADKIATQLIFQDGNYITLEEARESLSDRSSVSDNERAYEYVTGQINQNSFHFKLDDDANVEKWGFVENGYIYFYPAALTDICNRGGFKREMLMEWALAHDKAKANKGRKDYNKKIPGTTKALKFYAIKVNEFDATEEDPTDMFVPPDGEVPFD